MAIVLSGSTNDITIDGVSVATDAEVSSAIASGVAPKANTADLKEIGVGQTWQDVTASRVAGTTYTNSTGKPIFIAVNGISGGIIKITTDSKEVAYGNGSVAQGVISYISALVQNNQTYTINFSATDKIYELR